MGRRRQNLPKKFAKKLGLAAGTLLVGLVSYYLNPDSRTSTTQGEVVRSENFQKMHYTRHAKCRMECRFLSKDEVQDVIQNGKINTRKSDPNAKPCPVTAKEKVTKDGQKARIVFARCGTTLKVITAIDLGKKHRCSCS